MYTLVGDDSRSHAVQLGRIVLLAHAGLPQPDRSHCCHSDGNPFNNDPANLRWGSPSDNVRDAMQHGTARGQFRPGAAHPGLKYSDELVEAIRRDYRPGRNGNKVAPGSRSWLATRYNLPRRAVDAIIDRRIGRAAQTA
jgi:hypothetical protein